MADLTAKYYKRSLDDINWLSIVYLLSYLLFGLVAVWILDVLGLRTGVRISQPNYRPEIQKVNKLRMGWEA